MGLSGFQLFKPIFKEGCVMLTITCSLCFVLFFSPLEFGVASAPTADSELGFYRQLGGRRGRRALISLSPPFSGPLCRPLQAFALCSDIRSQTCRFPESRIFDSFGGTLRGDCASRTRHLRALAAASLCFPDEGIMIIIWKAGFLTGWCCAFQRELLAWNGIESRRVRF